MDQISQTGLHIIQNSLLDIFAYNTILIFIFLLPYRFIQILLFPIEIIISCIVSYLNWATVDQAEWAMRIRTTGMLVNLINSCQTLNTVLGRVPYCYQVTFNKSNKQTHSVTYGGVVVPTYKWYNDFLIISNMILLIM